MTSSATSTGHSLQPGNRDSSGGHPAFIDYINILFRWRTFIIRLVAAAGVFMVVYSLIMPKTFRSNAVIIPLQQESPSGTFEALSGQILGFGLGVRPTEIYLLKAIIESRNLRAKIIHRFNLLEVYETTSMDEVLLIVADHITVTLTEDNTLNIAFDHQTGWFAFGASRVRSAQNFVQVVASAIIEEMDRINREAQGLEARNYREFIEERRATIQQELMALEDSMAQFQTTHEVTLVDAQLRATYEAAAVLEAEVLKEELAVAIAKAKLGVGSPIAKNLDAQVRAARETFRQKFGGRGEERGYLLGYDRDLPYLLKRYLRLQRDITIGSELFAFITTKYEESRLREAQDIPTINILDYPKVPDKRTAPRRTFMVITTGVLMTILAVLLAFTLDFMQRTVSAYPEQLEAFQHWPWLRRWLQTSEAQ